MNNNIKKFYKYLAKHTELLEMIQKNLKNIHTEQELKNFIKLEVMPLAKKLNYKFTQEDLINYEKESLQHLTSEDLLNVAGGISPKSLILSGGLFSLVLLGSGALSGTTVHAAIPTNVVKNSVDNHLKNNGQTLNNQKESTNGTEQSPENLQTQKSNHTAKQAETLQYQKTKSTQTAEFPRKQETNFTHTQPAESLQSQVSTPAQDTEPLKSQDPTSTKLAEIQQQKQNTESVQNVKSSPILNQSQKAKQMPTETIIKSQNELNDSFLQKNEANEQPDMPYIVETLNLLDPYIYNLTGTTEQIRLFDSNKKQITFGKPLGNNVSIWEFNKDKGEGSPNFMRCLFPSSDGILNTEGGSPNMPSFSRDCKPTPEMIAYIIAYIHNKVRNENTFLINLVNEYYQDYHNYIKLFKYIEKYKLNAGKKVQKQSLSTYIKSNPNLLNTVKNALELRCLTVKLNKLDTIEELDNLVTDIQFLRTYTYVDRVTPNVANKKDYENFVKTYLYLLKNVTHMIQNQEISDNQKNDNKIFPKYTAEKMLMCYFIQHFNGEDDVTRFYNKTKEILLTNKNNNYDLRLNKNLNRLEKINTILNKINQVSDCPYTNKLFSNGRTQIIELSQDNKLKFTTDSFSDCADTVVRHIINLLTYNDEEQWSFILGEYNNQLLEADINKILSAIKKNNKIDKKTLKDRLILFFYYQKTKGGTDISSQEARTFWNYVISNMDNENIENPYKITYCRQNNELKSGWINCLKLTYNILSVLKSGDKNFTGKLANAKSKIDALIENFSTETSEDTLKNSLQEAIQYTFEVMSNVKVHISGDFTKNNKDIFSKINISKYDKYGNLLFSFPILQSDGHAQVDFSPFTVKKFDESENDLKIFLQQDSIAQLLTRMFNLKLQTYTLFNYCFTDNISVYSIDTLSSFHKNCNALKFLKSVQNEDFNATLINNKIVQYFITIDNMPSIKILVKNSEHKNDSGNEETFFKLILDKYINDIHLFIQILGAESNYKKGKEALFLPDYTLDPEVIYSEHDINTLIQSINLNPEYSKSLYIVQRGNNFILAKIKPDETISILYLKNDDNLIVPKEIFVKDKSYPVSEMLGIFSQRVKQVSFEDGFDKLNICKNAFHHCYELQSVTIPNSVTSLYIDNYAFFQCPNLNTFIFSNSATDIHIGSQAFFECTVLTKFSIPYSVTSLFIDNAAFYKCNNLLKFNLFNNISLKSLYIGVFAFYKCTNLQAFTVPDSVTYLFIGQNAFESCSRLKIVSILSSNNNSLTIKFESFKNCTSLQSFILPKSITSLFIESNAFYKCTNLQTFTIPEHVTSLLINSNSFYKCTNLQTFIVSNSVTSLSIGTHAFLKCEQLNSFIISNSADYIYIGSKAFLECIKLTEFSIPNSVTYLFIDNAAFSNCNSLQEFNLFNNVNLESLYVGAYAFYNCTNLQAFAVPYSVTSLVIGQNAFENCSSLKIFTIWSSVKNSLPINFESFKGCTSLQSFIFPNSSVSLSIKQNAFYECTNLKTFVIPDCVTSLNIEPGAFYNCTNLQTFSLPKNLKKLSIQERAFSCCFSLKNFNIPKSLVSLLIGQSAFRNCISLTKLQVFDKIQYLHIEKYAFFDCQNFNEFIAPDNIENIYHLVVERPLTNFPE